ncbi:5-bromo-4-chloroindolyl phosphate hydrolysis family protein [Blautia hansenii]|uniref:5-bromo-4-chloroindolyl phosphate hydrolysis family protein n=1 Tax=Blautia hansenii TaxID=1322 RepID=UPI0039844C14
MPVNDWNNLGRDVKDIVQHAINSGDFSALNRDLGATLDSALGNVAQSMKRAGNAYSNKYSYKPFGCYRNPSQRERMKEAREEFALFVNTNGAKALGLLFTTLGIALTIMFGVTAGILGILSLFIGSIASKIGTVMMIFLPAMGLSAIMGICGNRLRKKIKRFRSYVKTLNGKPYANVKDLAKSVRKSEKFVRKDLKKMIDKRMFLEGHLDKNGVCFMATDDAYEQYLETERNMEERKAEEARRPKTQLSEDVQKVIEEGNRYIEEIRRSNDAIPGVEISNKMYHLENVIRRIFQRVEKHPELINDLHKFMDYYLPTTMKLLNAYEELDKQDMQGENIKTAKSEIENTLDTINVAFENLLDSFYKETAWDVSSDISVLKTMFAQEGLTEKNNFQGKDN